MTWFNEQVEIVNSSLNIVHITDSHLFGDMHGEYFSVNTAQHLKQTLSFIARLECDAVVYGGDLTQDHSADSYHLFAQLVREAGLAEKLFWLPGNHDEIALYQEVLPQYGISSAKLIENDSWQILLANSKGETPAGWVEEQHLNQLKSCIEAKKKNAVVFYHHHLLSIEGYLDKHILENGESVLSDIATLEQVKAVFHGHVHNEYVWRYKHLSVFSTPATSIQFEKYTRDWQQCDLGPACRMIRLNYDGSINTQVIWLNNV